MSALRPGGVVVGPQRESRALPNAGQQLRASMAASLVGGLGDDALYGSSGDDTLLGQDGDDTIDAGAGADVLVGGKGDDSLNGGAGNDRITAGRGRDTIDGGEGVDKLDLSEAKAGLLIDLAVALQTGGLSIMGVEDVSGTRFDDTIAGSDDANAIFGWTGDDVLLGRGGADRLGGGLGADLLDGGTGDDTLDGGGGQDTLIGGDGDDWLIGDIAGERYDGGAGVDTLNLYVSAVGRTVNLAVETQADGSRITGVENVIGSAFNDTLVGSRGANLLKGGDGNDLLEGGGGADTLVGGGGADVFSFKDRFGQVVITDFVAKGDRHDILQFDRSQVSDWDTLRSFTRQVGTSLEISLPSGDKITLLKTRLADFTPDDVRFQGGKGMFIQREKLPGGSGYVGTFVLKAGYLGANAASVATITDQNGKVVGVCRLGGSISVPQGDHFEISVRTGSVVQTEPLAVGISVLAIGQSNMFGWVFGPSARQMADGTYLLGTAGPHPGSTAFTAFLREWIGDVPIGYTTAALGGTALLDPKDGKDYWNSFVAGGLYDRAMAELKQTTGGRAEIVLWNQGEADSLRDRTNAEYKAGLDLLMSRLKSDLGAFKTLIMGTPANNLYAGPGQPHYGSGLEIEQAKKDWVAAHGEAAAFMATPAYLGMRDGLHFNGAGYAWIAYGAAMELAALLLGLNRDDLRDERKLGTDGADWMVAAGGTRGLFFGGLGDDTIDGAGLGDILIGGEGDDLVRGMAGDDALEGEAGRDTLAGGDGADDLWGGRDNDLLQGGAGADMLDGGLGDDTMEGGAGDDLFVVNSALDVVAENKGEGVDRVQADISYTLSANVENLTLTGGAPINGTGNELANILAGNMGANRLDGCAGDDTLSGGTGADTLIGGLGDDLLIGGRDNDVFAFGAAFGCDQIADFDQFGDDSLQFSRAAFADWEAVWAATRQVGADLVISRSPAETITLKNVALSSFTADDVRFVD